MDAMSIAQLANPIIQSVFIVIIGLGYYYTTKAIRSQVEEMARESTTGGRPLIIVSEDYENLPAINLIIQNVGSEPAKNITFGFSAPIESSDGYVLSDLEAAPIGWQLFVRSSSLRDQSASLTTFETFATRLLAQALSHL